MSTSTATTALFFSITTPITTPSATSSEVLAESRRPASPQLLQAVATVINYPKVSSYPGPPAALRNPTRGVRTIKKDQRSKRKRDQRKSRGEDSSNFSIASATRTVSSISLRSRPLTSHASSRPTVPIPPPPKDPPASPSLITSTSHQPEPPRRRRFDTRLVSFAPSASSSALLRCRRRRRCHTGPVVWVALHSHCPLTHGPPPFLPNSRSPRHHDFSTTTSHKNLLLLRNHTFPRHLSPDRHHKLSRASISLTLITASTTIIHRPLLYFHEIYRQAKYTAYTTTNTTKSPTMSSSTSLHSPIPTRPRLIASLSTESFSEDLASAFAHSNSHPRVPDLNIRTPKHDDRVPCAPPPSPIDPALLSAGSSSSSLHMASGKVKQVNGAKK